MTECVQASMKENKSDNDNVDDNKDTTLQNDGKDDEDEEEDDFNSCHDGNAINLSPIVWVRQG